MVGVGLRRQFMRVAAGLVAVGALRAGRPAEARAQSTFTLGSTTADVRRAQGVPSVIERLHSLGVEIWTYGAATVRFSADSLRVVGWEDAGHMLRATVAAGPNVTTATTFGAGSHRDDVVRLMGTPVAIREDRTHGTASWRYGTSTVTIGGADQRVIGWIDRGGSLRVAAPATVADASISPRVAAPNAPATLTASMELREPSGNRALDGGESGTVVVELRNRGPGVAQNVRVGLTLDSSSAAIATTGARALARLDAGATARVEIPIAAPLDVSDGTATFRLSVAEANGFDLETARRLTIAIRATKPPKLALAGVRAEDQGGDGRISPRELVDVTVRVWNAGEGVARDVRATLTPGDDTFLAEESARQLTLGTIGAGEHRDLSFVAYTNTRARDARVVVTLTEATGRFGSTLTVPLPLERAIAQTLDATIEVPPRADETPATPTSLLDDVERDLPNAAEPNPDAIAVILGVERYGALPSARFAARDAQLVRRYATSAFGVTDDRNHVYVRTDADATGNEFRKLFGDDGWLARRVRPTSDIYVYFSGHGAPDVKSRTPYLLPTDADAAYPKETGYALTVLYQQLARLNARSVTVFLDACFTGATRTSGTLFTGARPIVISVEHPALLKDNFAVIAASGSDQIASDYPAKRHGLFTYFTLMGLRGAADADSDRTITVGELEQYLANTVPTAAASLDREQTPVVTARAKDRPIVRLRGQP
jgi:hypothetical protein